MNDQKLIKKILKLSHYDLSNNFTNWFSITGLLAIIIMLMFCGLCYVTSDYATSYWGWLPNMLFDWTYKIYGLIAEDVSTWMVGAASLVLITAGIMFPLVLIQNALDLAFDSSMSGFSLHSLTFAYIAATILSNGFLMLFVRLISSLLVFVIFFFMQTNFSMDALIVKAFMAIVSCSVIYFMQQSYFLGMHILEYKKGIVQSCKDLFAMVAGKTLFLCKILLLEVTITVTAIVLLYFSLGRVIKLLLPMILWFFERLQLHVEPVFIAMMYNFFYTWAYLLLYAWICIVTAHVYRQLVCPPVDNATCSSCQSCEI